MTEYFLNLVGSDGQPIDTHIAHGVRFAYGRISRRFPRVDEALMANWAEETALYMQARSADITFPCAYAYNRMKWMVFNYFNLSSSQVETVGTANELETHTRATVAFSAQHDPEYRMFLGRVRADLDDRENLILSLLINGYTLPEMCQILGFGRDYGRQVIARLKQKMAVVCAYTERRTDRRHCRKQNAA